MQNVPDTIAAPASAEQPIASGTDRALKRKILLDSLGLGFYIAWSFVFWNSSLLFGSALGGFSFNGLFAVQGGLTALTALLLVLSVRKVAPLRTRTVLLVVFALISSAAIVLAAMAGEGHAPSWLMTLGFALSGVGSTLRLGWEEHLSVRGVKRTAVCVVVAYFVGFVLFALASLLPPLAALTVSALMPFGACALLIVAGKRSEGILDDGRKVGSGSDVGYKALFAHIPWKLIAVIALAFFSYGATRTGGVVGGLTVSSSLFSDALAGLPAFASLLAAALAYFFYRKGALLAFYIAFPLMALAALLPASLDPFAGATTFWAALLGSELVKYMVWFLLIDSIIKDGVSALLCLGVMRFSQWAGSFLGQIAADVLPGSESVTIAILLALMIALLVIIGAPFFGRSMESSQSLSRTDSLEERTDELARRCRLSPREKEVLSIWVTGRSAAYIEKRLFISKNTVKTHLNHIYAKTGTANREELLELLDEIYNGR